MVETCVDPTSILYAIQVIGTLSSCPPYAIQVIGTLSSRIGTLCCKKGRVPGYPAAADPVGETSRTLLSSSPGLKGLGR